MNKTMTYRQATPMTAGKRGLPQAYLLRDAAHFGRTGNRLSPRNQQRLHRLRSTAAAVWRTVWRWL
ncbi:MAG: hypothetical protein RIS90_1880 [Pseudomonadota bacterium]|jgi:hypothetical protein